MGTVKNSLGLLLLISCSFIFINIITAEDEAKKETTSKDQIKIGDEVEYSGKIATFNKKGPGEPIYFLLIKEKLSVKLPYKIGDKKIEFEQFNEKQVVVKGKYGGDINESKDLHTIILTSIISIELKDTKATTDKKTDENRKEDAKKDIGNQSKD